MSWTGDVKIHQDRVKLTIHNNENGRDYTVEFNARDKDKAKTLLMPKILLDMEHDIKAKRIIDSLNLDTLDKELEKRMGKV